MTAAAPPSDEWMASGLGWKEPAVFSDDGQDEVATICSDIRHAGELTRLARMFMFALCQTTAALAGAVLALMWFGSAYSANPSWPVLVTCGGGVGGSVAGFVVALLGSQAYRERRRAAFRRSLAALPPDRLGEALRPLRRETNADTRRIVEPLLREFQPEPPEVAPAAAPAPRGCELVSGAARDA